MRKKSAAAAITVLTASLTNVPGAAARILFAPMLRCLTITNARTSPAARKRASRAAGSAVTLKTVPSVFTAPGRMTQKHMPCLLKSTAKKKYTQAIIFLKKAGYDYPKQFKEINDVAEIDQIFEQSLQGAK